MKGVIFMKESFGVLPSGETASLYTISRGGITAAVTDFGATLVRLLVPDSTGTAADVVLGYDSCTGYLNGNACLGATVGRSANRLKQATFALGGKAYALIPNEGKNNLHSGPDYFFKRMWKVESHTETAITLSLYSPHGDQGYPGNAEIRVTYSLEPNNVLRIAYQAVSDRDTVFNFTNHSYFNLAGHEKTDAAMNQILTIPGRFFNPADNIFQIGINQDSPRFILADSPRPHIKQLFFIQFTAGRSVGTFDIIGKNFQLRLAVDFRFIS